MNSAHILKLWCWHRCTTGMNMIMAYVPLICDYCGSASVTLHFIGVSGGGSVTAHLEGNRITCPVCGEPARIPDGTYRISEEAINLIQGSQSTRQELEHFRDVLRNILQDGTSVEEAQAEFEDQYPALTTLLEYIAGTTDPEERRFRINILLILLFGVLSLLPNTPNVKVSDVDINISVDQIFEAAGQQRKPPSNLQVDQHLNPSLKPRIVQKIGRNEPCICGSGKKYKQCCGNPVNGK